EYHRVHVTTLVGTLRTAGEASRRRLDDAIVAMLPDADALWQPLDGEPELVASDFLSADSATMQSRWRDEVDAVVGQVQWETLARPEGTRHERTPHFGPLYDRITEVFRLDPTATW
nr:phenylacetate-CoA oxygenase subunit PaaI [Acidimicrobiia bacterium]